MSGKILQISGNYRSAWLTWQHNSHNPRQCTVRKTVNPGILHGSKQQVLFGKRWKSLANTTVPTDFFFFVPRTALVLWQVIWKWSTAQCSGGNFQNSLWKQGRNSEKPSALDPYSLNPDPDLAKNLNPDPDPGKFFSPTKKFAWNWREKNVVHKTIKKLSRV